MLLLLLFIVSLILCYTLFMNIKLTADMAEKIAVIKALDDYIGEVEKENKKFVQKNNEILATLLSQINIQLSFIGCGDNL